MNEPSFLQERQGHMFKVTLALYRVTDFFSPEEPLRKKIREKANEIFEGVVEYRYDEETVFHIATNIIAKTDALKGYLHLAQSLKIVQPINLKILEREYSNVAMFFQTELERGEEKRKQNGEERNSRGKSQPQASAGEESLHIDHKEEVVKRKEEKTIQKFRQKGFIARHVVFGGLPDAGLNDRQKKILSYLADVHQARISDFFSFFADISSKTIQRDLKDLVGKAILKKEGDKRGTLYYATDVRQVL